MKENDFKEVTPKLKNCQEKSIFANFLIPYEEKFFFSYPLDMYTTLNQIFTKVYPNNFYVKNSMGIEDNKIGMEMRVVKLKYYFQILMQYI